MKLFGEPPDDRIRELARTILEPSSLADVAAAVARASRDERTVYVERIGDRWRWSLAHRGGPYPLWHITARYFGLDYQSLLVGARAVGDWSVLVVDQGGRRRPDAWRMVELPGPVSPEEAAAAIEARFTVKRGSPRRRSP